jgi:hypothetical protein
MKVLSWLNLICINHNNCFEVTCQAREGFKYPVCQNKSEWNYINFCGDLFSSVIHRIEVKNINIYLITWLIQTSVGVTRMGRCSPVISLGLCISHWCWCSFLIHIYCCKANQTVDTLQESIIIFHFIKYSPLNNVSNISCKPYRDHYFIIVPIFFAVSHFWGDRYSLIWVSCKVGLCWTDMNQSPLKNM